MEEKKNTLQMLIEEAVGAVLLSGAILFLIGLYYAMFKAGIPYQDPPLELQIKYEINMGIGSTLLKTGAPLILAGVIGLIVSIVIRKKKQ